MAERAPTPATAPVPPWSGGRFGERAECLLAPNPSMMTLEGTNTWVLREPGHVSAVVIDPGPVEDGHLDRLLEATGDVGLILLTHHHLDHSEVAIAFAREKGCAVRALDPDLCFSAEPLHDDEEIDVDGLRLRVVATPGHTADSVSFVVAAEAALLTGDMVLGRGTTVVAHPDGQLAPYLDSIERMRALVASGAVTVLWPAHGPVLDDAGGVLERYLAHRHQRLDQVREALVTLDVALDGPDPSLLEEGSDLPRRVVEIVYADVEESLWVPAELSVRAQLAYLAGP